MNHLRHLFARRLRWWQFSLRSVMLVCLLASIYLAILSTRHRNELAAIRAIEEQGGEVETVWMGPVWLGSLGLEEITPIYDHATEIEFVGKPLGDEDLMSLPWHDLPALTRVLIADCTNITFDVFDNLSPRFDGVDYSIEYVEEEWVEEEYVEELQLIDAADRLYDLATRYVNDPKAFSRGQLSRELEEITDSVKFKSELASDGVGPTIDGPYGNRYWEGVSIDFPGWTEGIEKLFESDQPEGQAAGARLLWRLHRSYSGDILDWAEKANRSSTASEILNSVKPKTIAQEIIHGDRDWGLELAALRPHHSLTPVLLRQLKPPYESQVIHALGESDDRRALDKLFEILHAGNSDTAENAAEAIVKIAGPSVRPRLMATLAADYNRVSTLAAIKAFQRIESLESPLSFDEIATHHGGEAKYRANERRAIDSLFKMMHLGFEDKSRLAVYTILQIAGDSSEPRFLATLAGDHNYVARLSAIEALGKIGRLTSIAALQEIAASDGDAFADLLADAAGHAIERITLRQAELPPWQPVE